MIKKCEFCGKQYKPYREEQKFCSDKCRYQKKDQIRKENKYPKFKCYYCGFETRLDFNPRDLGNIKDFAKWKNYVCSNCKKKNF